jgi:hypothetical protein
MKKFLACLLAAGMMLTLASCNPKEMVQDAVRDALGIRESSEESGGAQTSVAASSAASDTPPAPSGEYDEEFNIYIDGVDEWTPFPDSSGVVFSLSKKGVLDISDDGESVSFMGKQVGEAVITATLDDEEATALVRVRAREGGSGGWTLRIDEVTVLDVMSLASVTYDLDLTATHSGADMFGEYTGELAVEYAADLSGLRMFLELSGVKMDYETEGWFKNTSFRMELAPYSAEDEARFVDSLKDPNMTDEERAETNAYMESMFGDVGSGEKAFEAAEPVALWYDWAFHMTEGDMSAYVNMTSAMFSASASQDEKAQSAQGYADHILVGSFHESLSYENESPFPYQLEVYEGGEAVLTLRSPAESPIVVKFYGTLTQN